MTRHTTQKLCHFGRYGARAKLFRLKSLVSVSRAGVFIWENFHPSRDLSRKNRDLGNRASSAFHTNTSKFLRRKEWQGEILKTEPVRLNWAHMKRPLERKRKYIYNQTRNKLTQGLSYQQTMVLLAIDHELIYRPKSGNVCKSNVYVQLGRVETRFCTDASMMNFKITVVAT